MVIKGEDPEEFEIFREGLLEELAPAGLMELILAERIVSLSWRVPGREFSGNALLRGPTIVYS